ncbi:MAG: ABC transporter ATP-binding protein [Roseitalea sp.]|jgi:ABC-type glutathione transport system ATPase component|nr:ABC transporter ATP-binding protein [Roseitalea sp.]MBO6721200.1 ABC transporter ATP-binding protein [Roseitalea sp.]MBO6744258.1 ABC transporter ATP-binding protein [Roseitalea sp.]
MTTVTSMSADLDADPAIDRVPSDAAPVLQVEGLAVDFFADGRTVHAVRGVSFDLAKGRRLGVVGESGSGKTTTALALMRMIKAPGRIVSGRATVGGTDLFALSDAEMRMERMRTVSYIPQGAMNSLNPVYRIEEQFFDAMIDHGDGASRSDLRLRVAEALASVDLPSDVMRLYPHELSGGMKQRVCIAIGIILSPKLIIADEPTSALDVITQRQVMSTLDKVQNRIGAAMILIGHDIGLMAQSVDELMVMRDGVIEERGSIDRIFAVPEAAYTKLLIDSVPVFDRKPARAKAQAAATSDAAPLLELSGVSKTYGTSIFSKGKIALHPMSLRMPSDRPSIVAIVGQSGSGKTTLGQLALGLLPPTTGTIRFAGAPVTGLSARDQRSFRRDVQAIFQDPYSSFNPFYKVDHAFTVPLKELGFGISGQARSELIAEACAQVGLDPTLILGRFPHELSGGQRQRLMVARALILKPRLIVADEPVSMVDASQRASILANVQALKDNYSISVIYITHDLATAYQVSDFVIVLQNGHVVEAGPPEDVIGASKHPYTRLLINSIPWPDPNRPWASADELDNGPAAPSGAETFAPALHSFSGGVELEVPE